MYQPKIAKRRTHEGIKRKRNKETKREEAKKIRKMLKMQRKAQRRKMDKQEVGNRMCKNSMMEQDLFSFLVSI